jgi:membrane protease YdiL (CAAX protease family)
MKTQVDAFGIWFLVLMVVTLPVAVMRAANRQKPAQISRQRISQRLNNVAALIILALMALGVAWRDNIELFPPFNITPTLTALSIAILLGTLALAEALLQARSPEERRELWVRQIIPQNNAERFVWLISSTVAGVTEEIIFRGVLYALLVAVTSSVSIAALISALIFAVGHFRQGWKSMVFIFGIALLIQWLVVYAGSLVPAMIIHAIYNMIRGLRASYAMKDED